MDIKFFKVTGYMKCSGQENLLRQKADEWLPEAGMGMGIKCKRVRRILLEWWKCSQTGLWCWWQSSVNLLKINKQITELYS